MTRHFPVFLAALSVLLMRHIGSQLWLAHSQQYIRWFLCYCMCIKVDVTADVKIRVREKFPVVASVKKHKIVQVSKKM